MNQSASAPSASPQISGAQIDIPEGTVIFRQGDAGGDLYFIKEGEVEVYRTVEGLDVRLAILSTGEVLGIMTCLTREPRLASARTLSPVKALIVKQAGIKTLISSTPTWVHTVIKDFTVRVKSMDDLYGVAQKRVEELERETSLLRMGVRVAKGLAEVGALIATPAADQRIVNVDAALAHLVRILDVTPQVMASTFEAFVTSGLLKTDLKAAERMADLNVLMRLGGFADLAKGYLGSAEARAKIEALFGRDCAFMQMVCDLVKAQKVKPTHDCEWPAMRVATDGFPMEYVLACLKRLADVGLLKLKRVGDETVMTFVPATLLSGLHAVVAIAYFKSLGSSSAKMSSTSAAVVL